MSDACEICGRAEQPVEGGCGRFLGETTGSADAYEADCYRLGYTRELAAREAAEAQAAAERVANAGLRAALRDIDAQLATGFIRCETCGDQEDTADMDVRSDIAAALSAAPPNAMGAQPPAPASVPPAAAPRSMGEYEASVAAGVNYFAGPPAAAPQEQQGEEGYCGAPGEWHESAHQWTQDCKDSWESRSAIYKRLGSAAPASAASEPKAPPSAPVAAPAPIVRGEEK